MTAKARAVHPPVHTRGGGETCVGSSRLSKYVWCGVAFGMLVGVGSFMKSPVT